MVLIQNLAHDLRHGLYSKSKAIFDPDYVGMGSPDVINRRDTALVKCYPDTVVNDYVPFYFAVRTPMLYNIKTGRQVPQRPQEDVVYLCCRLTDLATDAFQWCFTDGNAAVAITRFFSDVKDLDQLDWRSIHTDDFRNENADGDIDRVRKKHAEFLVKDHVPIIHIRAIVVKTAEVQTKVKTLLAQSNLTISVHVNPKKEFYFL